jgi:hypothetical protein
MSLPRPRAGGCRGPYREFTWLARDPDGIVDGHRLLGRGQVEHRQKHLLTTLELADRLGAITHLWGAASAVERKQILRLVMKEVILDQRPTSGQVWIRVIWQTGAVSEHKIRRNVNSYGNNADIATLESRVRDLVAAQKMDREIATTLNAEGLLSARGGGAFQRR